MYKVKKFDKLDFLCSSLFCLLFCIGILCNAKVSINGAFDALKICGSILIPSLFPFMFLSSFAIRSSFSKYLSRILRIPAKILNLSPVSGTAVFFGLIGGYPVGARSIKTLYENNLIENEEAERMSYFCVAAGPAFLMGTVGSLLYNNIEIGIILFVSQLISSLIIGFLLSLKSRHISPKIYNNKSNKYKDSNDTKYTEYLSFSESFILSCKDASSAILNMCALVVIFGSITAILDNFLLDKHSMFNYDISKVETFFSILTEVTSGCNDCVKNRFSINLLAFAVGWGGLCVHFQIYSILGDIKINKFKFTICRLFQGLLSALFTNIIFNFFPQEVNVINIYDNNVYFTSAHTIFGGIAVLIMCIVFLFSLFNNKNIVKKQKI